MSFFRAAGAKSAGFNQDLDLLVVPAGQTTSLFFVDTSSLGTSVMTEDESIATVSEGNVDRNVTKGKQFTDYDRSNPISLITVKGVKVGSTEMVAKRTPGSDGIVPITIRVVNDPNARQAGHKGVISPEFRDELQGMPTLRDAVLRVAEDQMYSKFGHNTSGFGVYHENKTYNWCGAFAWYCWSVACKARNESNPFGDDVDSLTSCQKAVSWALQAPPGRLTILRYAGGDPFGTSFETKKRLTKTEQQEYIEISPANPVQKGDIMILRNATTGWHHVALVWEDTPAGAAVVQTIDGNWGDRVTRNSQSMKAKVNAKDFAVIFIHVHDSWFRLIDI
jgi:hypothetical protein